MAITFGTSTSRYNAVSAAVTTEPYTMFIRTLPASGDSSNYTFFAIDAASGANLTQLYRFAANDFYVGVYWPPSGTSSAFVSKGSSLSASQNNAAGILESDSSRYAWVNGTLGAQNTATRGANTLTRMTINGRFFNGTHAGGMVNGLACEAAVWNVVLTADELASLNVGFSPRRIRPQSLRFYAPMRRDVIDIVGGVSLTPTGTVSVSSHLRSYG